jgi:hypothetical protein
MGRAGQKKNARAAARKAGVDLRRLARAAMRAARRGRISHECATALVDMLKTAATCAVCA